MVPRRLVPALAAVALLSALVIAPPTHAATGAPMTDPGAAESEFVSRINSLRSSRGLGPLRVDGQLTGLARSWAGTMSSEGRIFHASDLSAGVTVEWQKLGENVGVGGNVPALFDAFVASPTHLANLVDPAFTHVGVGVVVSGDRIFTAHRFMAVRVSTPPTAPPTTAPPATTAPPTTAPPVTTAPPTTAPPPRGRLGAIDLIPELLRTG